MSHAPQLCMRLWVVEPGFNDWGCVYVCVCAGPVRVCASPWSAADRGYGADSAHILSPAVGLYLGMAFIWPAPGL